MIITAKPGRKEKIHIMVDGIYTATTGAEYWFSKGLKNGTEITEEELSALLKDISYQRMYEKALDLLSSRDYSKKELADKLVRKSMEKLRKDKKGFEEADQAVSEFISEAQRADYTALKADAVSVTDRLEELGLINEERYARMYATELFQRKHMGQSAVRNKLMQKGLPADLINLVLEELEPDPKEKIEALLHSKFKNRDLSDPKEKQRTVAALMRLGYRSGDIFQVISSEEAEYYD